MFKQAKWIWVEKTSKPDTYGEFYDHFEYNGGDIECVISCDSDYTLFINGRYVASNQYGDFEWYKSCDVIKLNDYLQKGKNSIAILVWHFGIECSRYIKAPAGVIFEVKQDKKVILFSSSKTLARYSMAYKNGAQKFVTPQLGLSFFYDSTKEDGWKTGRGINFFSAVEIDKKCDFISRPIKKLQLLNKRIGKIIYSSENRYLVDLGEEVVGLSLLKFNSASKQEIVVAWGEDLQNGHVRKGIGVRDFSFNYISTAHENEYVNYMLRISCRYIEIFTQENIEICEVGVIPQVYGAKEKEFKLSEKLDQGIYNACINTLKLCMMEHYVDTPWREQCLYVFDSRNQALFGYYAFENKNAEYARANLKLISKDRRADGLLSICYPCGINLAIPSFSLYYFMQVNEYIKHTNDLTLIDEVYEKLQSVIKVFVNNISNGLVCKFKNHWNFYDWSLYLDGYNLTDEQLQSPDLIINTLFVLALKNLKEICEATNRKFDYLSVMQECKKQIKNTFYNKNTKLFDMAKNANEYTVLGNSLAVLAGVATQEQSEYICDAIASNTLSDCSLSMKIFKYDALLLTNKQKWSDWVLSEIRKEYSIMINNSSTTVWETIDGAKAFSNAGSLCHGWSAVPIYYYHTLKNKI